MTNPQDLKAGDRVRVTFEGVVHAYSDGSGVFTLIGTNLLLHGGDLAAAKVELLPPEPKPLEVGEVVGYDGAAWAVLATSGAYAWLKSGIAHRTIKIDCVSRPSGIPITGEA